MSRNSRLDRSLPMPVKHWSRAGLLLTTRCNAACESCYLACGPGRGGDMSVENALAWWSGLAQASPHGCRVHLSGGEPFLDWPLLAEVSQRAAREGLTGLEMVETNAFWATAEAVVRDRLALLDRAGMGRLKISADPYHQQFVPIERCRLAARVGAEVLGPDRLQVRWRDWLEEGFDTDGLAEDQRLAVFAEYARRGRERLGGRAVGLLARLSARGSKPASAYADMPCAEALVRSRHVHIDGSGLISPGTCAGIVLGSAQESIAAVWRRLEQDWLDRPVLGRLARHGPTALLQEAAAHGFAAERTFAGKCHLCWELRRCLAGRGLYAQELGPAWMYEA